MSQDKENLTYDDKIELIKNDIELIKSYIVLKLSEELNETTEKDFKKDFNLFISRIEDYFFDVFGDKKTEKKLLTDIPQIKPYWNLIKEIHRYDKVMFGSINENQKETENQFADILKAKSTLQFIKTSKVNPSEFKLPGEEKLWQDSNANVKILRVSQFLAYVLSGKATKLFSDAKNNNPSISDSEVNLLIHKSFKENVHHLNLNDKGVLWYNIDSIEKSQPSRNVTDGVVFEQLENGKTRCYMVFATAKSTLASQRKQLFEYTDWFNKGKNNASEKYGINLSQVDEVVPVLVCFPLITVDNNINPFKNIFKTNENFSEKQVALINSIPFLSQLGNVDNSDTLSSINKLANTIYFTTGGGDTLALQEQLKSLKLIDSPEREKMFLKIYATKISAISNLFAEKTLDEKAVYLNNKNLNQELLNSFQGITAMMNGLIKHSAIFKDDEKFLDEIQNCLGKTSDNFNIFFKRINKKKSTDESILDSFSNATKSISPKNFKDNVVDFDIATNTVEEEELNSKLIKRATSAYINLVIEPTYAKFRNSKIKKTGLNLDIRGHFKTIVEHKIEHGEGAIFKPSEGFYTGTYQTFLQKYTNSSSKRYDNQCPDLNKQISELFHIFETNHTTADITNQILTNIKKYVIDNDLMEFELGSELYSTTKQKKSI